MSRWQTHPNLELELGIELEKGQAEDQTIVPGSGLGIGGAKIWCSGSQAMEDSEGRAAESV